MKPAPKDIFVYRGDYFEFWFQIRESVYNEVTGKYEMGPPRDLTDWTGIWQIRTEDDSLFVVEGDVTIEDQTIEENKGWVLLSLEKEVTINYDEATWQVYDCEMTDDLGKPRTFVEGKVTGDTDVSHA